MTRADAEAIVPNLAPYEIIQLDFETEIVQIERPARRREGITYSHRLFQQMLVLFVRLDDDGFSRLGVLGRLSASVPHFRAVVGRLNSLSDLRGGDRCLSRDSVGCSGRDRSGRSSGGAGDDKSGGVAHFDDGLK
jgi:hypothetical protein